MDTILQLLDLLNKYSSLFLVIATLIYVVFTVKLAKETRKLREVETSPLIGVIANAIGPTVFKLTIKNIGKAPAYNLSFLLDDKYFKFFRYGFNHQISYFAPEQEFSILTSGYKELKESEYENIPIKIKYFSKDGLEILDTYVMEWQYLDKVLLEEDTLHTIKKELEHITKELKNLNSITKDKKYLVSTKLSILELEKNEAYVQFIFSNGEVFKIDNDHLATLELNDVEKIYIENGDLIDYSLGKRFLAEEIYAKIK